jgi:hypothetical protein
MCSPKKEVLKNNGEGRKNRRDTEGSLFLQKKMPERGTQASRKRILQFFNQNLQLYNSNYRAKT